MLKYRKAQRFNMKLINVVVFDEEYEGYLPVSIPLNQIKQLSIHQDNCEKPQVN